MLRGNVTIASSSFHMAQYNFSMINISITIDGALFNNFLSSWRHYTVHGCRLLCHRLSKMYLKVQGTSNLQQQTICYYTQCAYRQLCIVIVDYGRVNYYYIVVWDHDQHHHFRS